MKIKKNLVLALCCVMMLVCFTGCKATKEGDSSSYIKANIMTGEFTLNRVTYYDFISREKLTNYSGDCSSISNTLTSTSVWFTDGQNDLRCIELDKALSTKPSEIKVYTDVYKTKWDPYKVKY